MSHPYVLATILGISDLFGAFAMLGAMVRITSHAGWHDAQAMWAFGRRVIYGATAIALFGLGVGRLDGAHPVTNIGEFIFQEMLLFGVIIFPLLRAFGWITQDQFKAVDGTATPGTGRGHR